MILGFYRLKKSPTRPEIWSFKIVRKIYSFQIFCTYLSNFHHKLDFSSPDLIFMVSRGCNDPQVLQQCHYGQINIDIATQCIKSGHQSQQKIEIWWKSAIQGPNLEVSMWSQNLIFGILWPICSCSHPISIVLGPGDHFNT